MITCQLCLRIFYPRLHLSHWLSLETPQRTSFAVVPTAGIQSASDESSDHTPSFLAFNGGCVHRRKDAYVFVKTSSDYLVFVDSSSPASDVVYVFAGGDVFRLSATYRTSKWISAHIAPSDPHILEAIATLKHASPITNMVPSSLYYRAVYAEGSKPAEAAIIPTVAVEEAFRSLHFRVRRRGKRVNEIPDWVTSHQLVARHFRGVVRD
jgi:hypothetical protein